MDGKPLNIAIFSDSALPILNGVSVSIDCLVRELRERGHRVHVFTSAHFNYRDPDPNTHRFPAVQTPWTRGYPLAFPPFYPMLLEFRRQRFDVIHTHTPFTIGLVGLRWAQSHEIPIVSTYHTLYDKYAHYVPFFPKRYIRYKIAKHTNFYYNSVDHVITPSEASLRWLQRHSIKRPITVIPTGVIPPRPGNRSEVRQSLGIAPSHKVMVYAGRIAKEKNMGMLLSSAALAFAEDPHLRLWLVGDGPARQDCLALIRNLGIGDRVTFVGFVPRPELDRYYSAADLFVFSSTTETQGLVVVEAMTHGLPALVVRGGGAGEAVVPDVNGYLLANSRNDMATAMVRVMNDDSLYSRLSDGARRTSRQYTVPVMTDRVLDVYRETIGAPRPSQEKGVAVP